MRPARRVIKAKRRQVRTQAERPSLAQNLSALRRSREALSSIENQLGDLLHMLHAQGGTLDKAAPDRLARAKAEACEAMASLHGFAQLF
jgi:hypothetical protein